MSVEILTTEKEEHLEVLKSNSFLVTDIEDVQEVITNLKKCIEENDKCYSISAPQIGVNKCLFILADTFNKENVMVCINPEIIKLYDNKIAHYREGCLSEPDLKVVTRRYKMIKVAYFDETGKRNKKLLRDEMAVAFQHEMDHLFGHIVSEKAIIIDNKNWEAINDGKENN